LRGLGSRLTNTTGFSRRHRLGVFLIGLAERREPLLLVPSCESEVVEAAEEKLRAGRADRSGNEVTVGRERLVAYDGLERGVASGSTSSPSLSVILRFWGLV